MNCEKLYRSITTGKDPEAPEGLAFLNFIAWVCRYLERQYSHGWASERRQKVAGGAIATFVGWLTDHVSDGDLLHSSRAIAQTTAWTLGRPFACMRPEVHKWSKRAELLRVGDGPEYLPTSIKGLSVVRNNQGEDTLGGHTRGAPNPTRPPTSTRRHLKELHR